MMFYLLAISLLATALAAALARKMVYAILGLAFFFTALAGMYGLLGAEFLAVAQLLVFVGGIVVMLLMALNISQAKIKFLSSNMLLRILLAVAVFGLLAAAIGSNFRDAETFGISFDAIAELFFTHYFALVLLFGLLMFTGVVVALYFLRRDA